MNVRDYITAAILYVLMFLVYAGVGAPIGMTVAGSLFVFAACAVVWGTIFMLLFTKVNKKGIVLLFGLIWAAMQLMSFWGVALVIAVGAVIAELFLAHIGSAQVFYHVAVLYRSGGISLSGHDDSTYFYERYVFSRSIRLCGSLLHSV